jgi:hypothetical protein
LRVLSALTLTSSSLSAVFNVSAAFVRMHRWRTSPRLDAQLFFLFVFFRVVCPVVQFVHHLSECSRWGLRFD